MHRFHIRDMVIIKEYLKRYKNNDWDEEECRDDEKFLKIKEEMWSTMYLDLGQAPALVAEDEVGDEVGDEVTLDYSSKGDNLSWFFDGHDNSVVYTEFARALHFRSRGGMSSYGYGSLCLVWVVMCWYG